MKTRLVIFSLLFYMVSSCTNPQRQDGEAQKVNSDSTSTEAISIKEEAAKVNDSLGVVIDNIEFKVKAHGEELSTFEDGFVPWISIQSPNDRMKDLIGKDSIVIKEPLVLLYIDYPLNKPAYFQLISKDGFSRKKLIEEISKKYHEVYAEEERTSTIKPSPPEKEKMTYNRNETNGKYGIWGHDMIDLDLTSIIVHKRNDNMVVLGLEIDS